MANEWTKVELYGANNDGDVRRYTIADGTSVSKGTLLALTDPRTVTASALQSLAFAGVASEEHIAGQGVTSVAAWTNGIFEATASGAITVGAPIVAGTAGNAVASGSAWGAGSGAIICGYALEAASNNEVIYVRLRL